MKYTSLLFVIVVLLFSGGYSWLMTKTKKEKKDEKPKQDPNLPDGYYLEFNPERNEYRWCINGFHDMFHYPTKRETYEAAWKYCKFCNKTKLNKWNRVV